MILKNAVTNFATHTSGPDSEIFKVGEGRGVSLPLIVFAKVGRTQEGIQNGGINILLGLAPPSPTFKV